MPTPSPAIRAPRAPARTADDTFLDLVESGTAHAPGYRPKYADDVTTVVTFFDRKIKDAILSDASPTLGRQGGVSFVMPMDDADLISSLEDAVVATGHAPSASNALKDGAGIFGIEAPAASLDLRAPTRLDAANYLHYTEGGHTATNVDGLYMLNRIREMVVDGGTAMPKGSILFHLMPDGSRLRLAQFS